MVMMMTAGYWTILYLIVYSILLVTGWRAWLNKYIVTSYGVLFFIFVLSLYRLPARVVQLIGDISVYVHISVLLVTGLLVAAACINKGRHPIRYVLLSIVMFGLAWALMKVLLHYSPSLEHLLYQWNLPILCGILLACLSLSISQACYVIFGGAMLGEYIAAWQQKGQYIGEIGTLGWWDLLLNTLFIVVIVRFISYMLAKGLRLVVKLIVK